MSTRKKGKKSSSRSASAANRISKSQKKTFVKRPSLKSPKSAAKAANYGVIKKVAFGIVLLVVGATVLAKVTGANKVERGTLMQDAACESTNDCALGHVCYGYQDNPFTCKERCDDDSECTSGHKCKPVVRLGKKRVKPMTVCVREQEL